MDNIFDANIGRRIQHLQQQSVNNIIKVNPNLRSVLSRYEDAEVSRLKLLELQQLRSKKLTPLEKKALKGLAKRARPSKGRAPKEKKVEPQKSTLEVEIDREKQLEKIKQEERKLTQQDRFLQLEDFRQQREFVANERRLQLGDVRRQTEFISGQNRIAADQQIAQYNQAQQNFRAGQSRQLEERKLQEQIRDIRERVGRDDAFRHRQLEEQQRLALEQLAAQRLDNTERAETERIKIQNQRAVDAERAITDREREQTLQAALDRVNRTQEAQELPIGRGLSEEVGGLPTGRGLVEDVSLSETSGSGIIEQERKFERRGLNDPLVEGEPTPGALRENPKPKVKQGGATEAEILSVLGSASSNTSLHSVDTTPESTLKETGVYKPNVKTLAEVRRNNPVEEIRD